jgi:hypothetical protein
MSFILFIWKAAKEITVYDVHVSTVLDTNVSPCEEAK